MNLLYGCFCGSGGYVNSNKIVLEELTDKVDFVVNQSFQVVLFLYNFITFQPNTHLNSNNFGGCISTPEA